MGLSWPPRTWVAGEVGTAALLNAQLRNNLSAMNGFVYKTSDQALASNTTMQNDGQLAYTMDATGTYVFDVYLDASSLTNGAGDLKVGFTFPSGTMSYGGAGPDIGLASSNISTTYFGTYPYGTAVSGASPLTYGLSTTAVRIHLHGLFIASATGTLQLQWAQNSSNVFSSTVLAGSHMRVCQVA